MANEPDDPIGAEARHNARMQMGNESVRGLFLINGGGAVALLAFLQALWEMKQYEFAGWVLGGLVFFTLGVICAAPINQLRAESSLHHQYGPAETAARQRKQFIFLTYLAIFWFVAGCVVVVAGGAIALCAVSSATAPP